MKNGTTVICTNIFKGKTEEEIKKRFNICIAKIIQRESLAYSETGQIRERSQMSIFRQSIRKYLKFRLSIPIQRAVSWKGIGRT